MTAISTARNGRIALAMDSTRSPETLEATNSTSPMGGVARPTVRFTLMIIAKCTGSTPRAMKIGARIGPRMMIAGPASRNMPMMNSRMLIRNSRISGFSLIASTQCARDSAAPDRLTTVLNAIAAPTSNSTTADDLALRVKMAGRSRVRTERMTRMLSTRA